MSGGTSPAARRLADALAQIEGADVASLEKSWRQAFGRCPPPGLTRGLLGRVLAYRLQAQALGDLDRDTARGLDRMAGADGSSVLPLPDTRGSQHGTVLLREWQGTMQTVMVMEDGYAWNGTAYRSLSEVARAITGTRWNGPRFFGLRDGKTLDGTAGATGRAERNDRSGRRRAA